MKIISSIKPHPPEAEDDAEKQVYDVSMFNKTILTTATMHPYAAIQWIDALNADENTAFRYVGFELEFDDRSSRIGTLQLCVGNRCLVFQLSHSPLEPSLAQFLANQKNIFIGIDVSSKMDQLRKQCPFEALAQCMDFDMDEPLSQQRNALQLTLGSTVETDWDRPMKLSHKQVLYACLDAFLILFLSGYGSVNT